MVFVDSASLDQSVQIAVDCGVDVIEAPLGKGRAMRRALAACETEYLCFIDADIHDSERNIPRELAKAVRAGDRTMVVGEFTDVTPGILSNTIGIYEPLIATLVPEAAGRFGSRPLTGFRIINTTVEWGRLPPGFGVETHLNIFASQHDRSSTCTQDIGEYQGRFLYKPKMGLEIAKPILDWAQSNGRLDPAARSAWDAWVAVVVAHISTFHGQPSMRVAFRKRLLELAARPLPPAHAAAPAA